jgi:hypothetical protein
MADRLAELFPATPYSVVSRRRPMSSAAATPINTSAAAPNSSALVPESPPVFGSELGALVGVAVPAVVAAVAAAVAPVVVAAAVAAVVVAAAVAAAVAAVVVAAAVAAPVVVAASVPTAVPVVCSAGAAPLVAPTNGTSIKLNTMTAATATIAARDVLRIPSSLILDKRPAKHTAVLRRIAAPQRAIACKFHANVGLSSALIG